jgi:hypothetical protein
LFFLHNLRILCVFAKQNIPYLLELPTAIQEINSDEYISVELMCFLSFVRPTIGGLWKINPKLTL